MNRTLRRALRDQKTKAAYRDMCGAVGVVKDAEELATAALEAGHRSFIKGQQDRLHRGIPQNYNQFMFTSGWNAEDETEEYMFKLMYGSYLNGYEGGTWDYANREPTAQELTAQAAAGIMAACGGDMKRYEEIKELTHEVYKDMESFVADGRAAKKAREPKLNLVEFILSYGLIPLEGNEEPVVQLASTLYLAYCRGYDGR